MNKTEHQPGTVKKVYEAKDLHLLFCGKTLFVCHEMEKLKGLEKELERKYPQDTIHVSYLPEIEVFVVE